MARNTIQVEESLNMTLEELIPAYAFNKKELDSYKDICDKFNTEIKSRMLENGMKDYSAGGYTAKRIVTKKETFNEPKLIKVLKESGLSGAVKTVEVVDYDALEQYLYTESPSMELISAINNCKSVKEVVQLRITKSRKES